MTWKPCTIAKAVSAAYRNVSEWKRRLLPMNETEHVRWKRGGTLFRVVSREVSGVETLYMESKQSSGDEWKETHILGFDVDA